MERAFRQSVARSGLSKERLLLGVSGGIDSVVLLDLLVAVAAQFDLQLHVLHLDHQIRSASGVDAEFVHQLCCRLHLPCQIESVNVPQVAVDRHLSLEMAGREIRREKMRTLAARQQCRRVVLGHHRDDQAETFLQRLLRGSGLSGLQAMREDDGFFWRPLLSFSRSQIEDHAQKRQLEWVEDDSNLDPRYLRNRLRHQVLPQLTDINPRISERLAGLCQQLQSEEDFWQTQIAEYWPHLLVDDRDGLRLDVAALNCCHPALRLRLLREGLRLLRGDLSGIDAVHLEALHGLLGTVTPQAELDLPGCWAGRRYASLWLRRKRPDLAPFSFRLEPGVPLELPDGQFLLAEKISGNIAREDARHVLFDAGALQGELRVRTFLAGDRFVPSGMQDQRKIKDFFIDQKLEKEARNSLPILLAGDQVLWLVGLRRSGRAEVTSESREILSVRLLDGPN